MSGFYFFFTSAAINQHRLSCRPGEAVEKPHLKQVLWYSLKQAEGENGKVQTYRRGRWAGNVFIGKPERTTAARFF
jgi:hypothetical protein